LVLKGMFGMFVHGLGLFCLSSFRLKAMNGLRNPLGGGGTGREPDSATLHRALAR
jgi:hypothetical protein